MIQASQEYLGEDGVRWMIALKPLQEASAFRTWCRGLGMDISSYDDVAKNLDAFRDDPQWKDIIEDSKRFIGVVDSIAPSPCSVLLYDKPISKEIGLIKVGDLICCCIDGYNSDVFKYVKNDYLTVKVWGLIDEIYKKIKQPIDSISELLHKCDDEVWDLFGKGLTTTVNQCDSDYDKQILVQYKPRNIVELSMYVAAIRPGFKSMLQNFIQRKPYSTDVPELDELLKDSFHYMAYQENIMTYLHWLGVPEKDTYTILKQISKKKMTPEELSSLEQRLEKEWVSKLGSDYGFHKNWQAVQDSSKYSFNACVSGDTLLYRSVGGKSGYRPTVEEMYLIRNDIQYAHEHDKIPLRSKYLRGYGKALSLCEDNRLRLNNIIDIRQSGIQPIYRITLENGAYIDCTKHHKFPMPNGQKKEMKDLLIGEELLVKGEYDKKSNFDRHFSDGTTSNVPKKGEKGFQKRPQGGSVLFHNEYVRHVANKDSCAICEEVYDPTKKFELHHIDMNRKNNDSSNLIWLCNSCHKKEHYRQGRNKQYSKGIPILFSKIKSIEYLRDDMTYDVEMEAPYHTFVTSTGIVTSNSHSLSVALDALYGAYLKTKYPLEYFSVALGMYADDEVRTNNLTNELKAFHITLQNPKFKYSGAGYMIDYENRTLTKGIESIKYLNIKVAEELYSFKDKTFDSFLDVLSELKYTSINSRQLDILIDINFFEEYGNPNYLSKLRELFETFDGRKQISIKQYAKYEEDFNLPDGTMDKLIHKLVSDIKPDAKIIKGVDMNALMKMIIPYFSMIKTDFHQMISKEIEHLGYGQTINPNASKRHYCVIDEGKKKKRIIKLYEPYTGKTQTVVAWETSLTRNNRPLAKGDWIEISKLSKRAKAAPTGTFDPKTGRQIWKADPALGYEYWLSEFNYLE